MIKIQKVSIWMTAMLLSILIAGCVLLSFAGFKSDASDSTGIEPSQNSVSYYPSSYFYSYADAEYITNDVRQKLENFGNIQCVEAAVPEVKIYKQIPESVNNASGTSPICKLQPELDISQYVGGYSWIDDKSGLNVNAHYRTVNGMLTDELVRIYIDSSGNVVRYDTVNLGKYDKLDLDESQVESLRLKFRGQIKKVLNGAVKEYYAPKQTGAPSAYMLFTNENNQLVITTAAVIEQDHSAAHTIRAVLYAVVG